MKIDTLDIHFYIVFTELEAQHEMHLTGIGGHGAWVRSYRIAGKFVLEFPDIFRMNALYLKSTSYEIQKKDFYFFCNTVYEDHVSTKISFK